MSASTTRRVAGGGSMPRNVKVKSIARIGDLTNAGELVAFDCGPDHLVYLVWALKPLEYRTKNGMFSISIARSRQNYRVVALADGRPVLDLTLQDERFNIHSVQPARDRLLLYVPRS